ncbi:MAG: hypothetical protein MK110_09370 [Fuerstiella sp.]|nr:hypothetical protein [Fuerstiella sp.]
MCEIAKEPCLSFVKPYELPVLANGDDLESALRGFLAGGDLVTYNNRDLKEKQRGRLERHGECLEADRRSRTQTIRADS